MNKNILIATALAAGTTALVYFIRKRRKPADNLQHAPAGHSRHLIDSFAKAKRHASNGNGNRVSMSDK